MGKAAAVTAAMVKPGATVVDVGINRVDGQLVGDVAADAVDVAGKLTPVPGGVGPMTIAALLRNTVRAARYQAGELAFPGDWRYLPVRRCLRRCPGGRLGAGPPPRS